MPAPANDLIANAATFAGSLTTRSGVTAMYPIEDATLETGETTIPGGFHSSGMHQTIWFRWVADTAASCTFITQLQDDTAAPKLIVYQSLDGTGDFAQLVEVAYGSTGSTAFTPDLGAVYYFQVGTASDGRVGTRGLQWTLGAPALWVGECATYVGHIASGTSTLFAQNPSINNMADPSSMLYDGYFDIYWSSWEVGQLLVAVVATTQDGIIETPPGWTSSAGATWGPRPYSYGVNPGYTPFFADHANIGVFWRIADGTEGTTADVAFTVTGLGYHENGSVGEGTTDGGGIMFTFDVIEVGTFNRAGPFPASPILYAGMDAVSPSLEPDPDDTTTHHTATYPTATADAIGNHLYMQIMQLHGYEQITQSDDDYYPTVYSAVLEPTGFDPASGGHVAPYDGSQFVTFANALNPYDTSDTPVIMTDSYSPGSSATYGQFASWADGFIGVEGVDWDNWTVVPGIAALSFVIQAPESRWQTNGSAGSAFVVPSCPITLYECTFNAQGADRDLWFRFTAGSDTVTIGTAGSDYDTFLYLYDAGLSLVASDDDSGPGTTSLLNAEPVTAGATYYIKVTAVNPADTGILTLTLDSCTGGAAYWGILAALMN